MAGIICSFKMGTGTLDAVSHGIASHIALDGLISRARTREGVDCRQTHTHTLFNNAGALVFWVGSGTRSILGKSCVLFLFWPGLILWFCAFYLHFPFYPAGQESCFDGCLYTSSFLSIFLSLGESSVFPVYHSHGHGVMWCFIIFYFYGSVI